MHIQSRHSSFHCWNMLPLACMIIALLNLGTGFRPVAASGGGFKGCSAGETAQSSNPTSEQQVADQLNVIRVQYGLPAFRRVQQLDNAARYHATDMGQEGYFQHASFDRVDGQLVQVCGTWDRLHAYYNYGYAGENLAMNVQKPQEVVDLWMNSPGHRESILDPNLTEIGVGFYQDAKAGASYWVLDFGSPAGPHPAH